MALVALTAREFGQLKSRDPRYYTGRWPYLSVASSMASRVAPSKALELGPYRRSLLSGSDTMDRVRRSPSTKVWDATKVPWPYDDGAYDLFVALQVWEHLGSSQREAFAEVRRVARQAILSFPYGWKTRPGECHHGITQTVIARWTLGVRPVERVLVDRPNARYRRLVCRYDFR